MTIETDLQELLELMDRPAFCVGSGMVLAANQAAQALNILPDTPVARLIHSGLEDYRAYSDGILFLTVAAGAQILTARVTRLGTHHLFALSREEGDAHLQALALAAQQLRGPLHQVISQLDQVMPGLEDSADGAWSGNFQQMNRGLYQLLRLVGNMSDASGAGVGRMEIVDLTCVMQEIGDHASALCEAAGKSLIFENHPAAVFSLADSQKLERAVYNLLSNAMKHTPTAGQIRLRFARRGAMVQILVCNDLSGDGATLEPGSFDRYLRLPGIGGGQSGLGLGMTLVRAVASAHQGSVLFRQTDGRMEAVLSLPIRQDTGTLRSPALRIDYAGERDHGLVELSEFLPPELYSSKY